MAKFLCDSALDAVLEYITDNVSHIHVLSDEPTEWADIASYTLGNTTLVSADFASIGDYSEGGRQLVVPTKTITIGASPGTINYVALVDTTGTEILAYSDTAATAVTASQSFPVPPWNIYSKDPT